MVRLRAACLGLGLAASIGCSVLGGLDDLKSRAGSGGKTDGGGGVGVGGGGWGGLDGGGDSATACPPGRKACGGACVDVSDPNTGCGAPSCDPCSLPHAAAICVGGACAASQCEVGFQDCNSDGSDGCEASIDTDPANCGTCFTSCALPHALVSCQGGACKFDGCNTGFDDCNGDPKDGCEVNVGADPKNCGSCGSACTVPSGKSATCNSGQCGTSNCAAPLANCDQDPTGSCEVDLTSSLANCGFCGNACSFANATASCNAGVCALGACNAGFSNCDGNDANGCETNTGASTQNCGTCNTVCSGAANATAVCNNGSCGLPCNAGYGDCNSNLGDGCETTLTTLQNCGTCGNAISASGNVSGGKLCGASGSVNKLQFYATDNNGSCTTSAGAITLSGVTATGDASGNTLCEIDASGDTLQFYAADSNGNCNQSAGTITLGGATVSGYASGSKLCGVGASGYKLQFYAPDNGGSCGNSAGNITLACKP